MQKMPDNLFSVKKNSKDLEENPKDLEKIQGGSKKCSKKSEHNSVGHMDVFGEFNTKRSQEKQSKNSPKEKTKSSIKHTKASPGSILSDLNFSNDSLDDDLINASFATDFGFSEIEDDEGKTPLAQVTHLAKSTPQTTSQSKANQSETTLTQASPQVELEEEGETPLAKVTHLAKSTPQPGPQAKADTQSNKSSTNKKSTDVSMHTRASAFGDYLDKIKEKQAALNAGEKLNRAKQEAGDEVTMEDKLYSQLENGCNVALDVLEGAGENLAFRFKRGFTSLFSSFQNKMMKKKFKRNDNIIQYGDFMFYEMNEELMLYKYVGIQTEIKIPSYVEGMPVCYLEKNFLRFNGIKSVGRGLSIENIQDVSIESIKDSFFNVRSIQLPDTLKIIPSKVFSGCTRIDELIIPESVTLVQPNAFVGCRPSRIIFLGEAPKQLQDANLAKVKIFCKKEHFNSFFKLMRNYDDYISNKKVKEKYFSLRKKVMEDEETPVWDKMRRATDLREEALAK